MVTLLILEAHSRSAVQDLPPRGRPMDLNTHPPEALEIGLVLEGRVGGNVERRNDLGVASYVLTLVDHI